MEHDLFDVYYLDGLKPDVSHKQAVERLCQLFKVSNTKAEKMLHATHRVVKSGLTMEQAEKYVVALDQVGMKIEVRQGDEVILSASTIDANASDETVRLAKPDKVIPQNLQPSASTEATAAPVSDVDGDKERVIPIEFKGQGFEYFKIWIVNLFLTIITLGIYSAWAKVRNTQYFYANTEIDGSHFNYTAKPLAILIGRVIAVGFFAVYILVNQFFPIFGLLLFVLLLVFIPWIMVKSMTFNARNSVYRNIRFNFDGKMLGAAKVFIFWPILIPFTLGLIFPYIWYKQRNFILTHSQYGTTHFQFHAGPRDYYKIFLYVLLIFIVGGALAVGSGMLAQMIHPMLSFLVGPLILVVYLLVFAFFAASVMNLQYNNLTLANHSFTSAVETKSIAWLYFSNTLGIILTLGLFIPWAQVRMAKYRASRMFFIAQGSLDHFIEQEQQQVSALGEQVGDVFDFEISVV